MAIRDERHFTSLTISICIFIFLALLNVKAIAQTDTIFFNNSNHITGEIKDMDRNVLKIETSYSDDDFTIEWKEVREIYTQTNFFISLSDGQRYIGRLTTGIPGQAIIITKEDDSITCGLSQIVYLKSMKNKFSDRLNANIDLGFSLTRSNYLRQFNLSGAVGYLTEDWMTEATLNMLKSTQTNTEPIQRFEATFNFTYVLENDWYLPVSVDFLSNSEQKIKLRTLAKLGVGKYIMRTNSSYWGFSAGTNYNNEDFTEAPTRNSLEAFLGSELNLYDIGDLNLMSKVVAYPSITESGRFRTDFVLNVKYDLPLDFYVKLGININYDNRPVEDAPETDYVLTSGIGWEW